MPNANEPRFPTHVAIIVDGNRRWVLKRRLGGGIHLALHYLARQVCLACNSGILGNYKYLCIGHIRLGPCVIILTAGHGETVPDTVNVACL